MNQYLMAISVAICMAFIHCAEASANTTKKSSLGAHLPLGITEAMPLNKVELVFGFYSAKTGVGRQEISILADGTVKLFFSCAYDDPHPKIMEAKCDSGHVLKLFELLEGMGFNDFPEEYGSDTQSNARRILTLSMPGRQKTVAIDVPGNYAIEQCIGAIKLCAGLCIPEAINQKFFPNL